MKSTDQSPVEATLRDELAHGDAVLGSVAPILGHLVATPSNYLFNDQLIASARGMCLSIAKDMLRAQAHVGNSDPAALIDTKGDALAEELMANSALLTHCHAQCVEAQLTKKLQDRNDIDQVISPLLQAMIASDDEAGSGGAMTVLTAQARFIEQTSRMELPITELPGYLFQEAVTIWRSFAGAGTEELTARAEMHLRKGFDEGQNRLGLVARLAEYLADDPNNALSIPHAGVAIFLSALARAAEFDRNLVVLSTSEQQMGRLALSLCAAGQESTQIEEQFLFLHPDFELPEGFEQLRADRAAQILQGDQLVELD